MDDGAVQRYGVILCTQCFSYEDNIRLCRVLHNLYGLDCKIYKAGLRKNDSIQLYRIKIAQSSMGDLRRIVQPYMCPSMLYKLKGNINKI